MALLIVDIIIIIIMICSLIFGLTEMLLFSLV